MSELPLPSGWVAATVEDITEYVQRGKSPKYIDHSDLPVINQKCVRWDRIDEEYLKFIHPDQKPSWSQQRYLQNGDILWNSTGTGTVGRAGLFMGLKTADQAVVDSHVTVLRVNSTCHPQFLFLYIQSPMIQNRIDDMHTGSTNQVELSKIEILSTGIPLPPLAEQQRIVAKLDAVFARTRQARVELERVPKLVEDYKQAILSAAFRGELTADWREENAFDHVVVDINRNDNLIEQLPNAWHWTSIQNIAYVSGGLTKNAKRREIKHKVPYLRVANVYSDELRLDDVREIGCTEKELRKTQLQRDDLLVVEGNGSITQIGRAAIWDGSITPCSHQNHLIRIRPDNHTNARYVLFWMLSSDGRRYIERVASSSSGLYTLSIRKISSLAIPVCSNEEQCEVVRILNELFASLDSILHEATRAFTLLDHLEQATLAKAFRGELVPQDPNDEPASVLLERIRAEREAKTKKKKRR